MAGDLEGLTCGWCGKALTNCTIRREYCDRNCARRFYAAEKRARTVASRKCLWCSGPIAPELRPGTIYCAESCSQRSGADMSRKRNKRACKQCGTAFFASVHQVYCSHECYCDGKRTRHAKQCPTCQKVFRPHRVEQVCCSQACAAPSRRRLADIACGTCGTVFRPKNAKVRFCCASCASRSRAGQ